MSTMTIDRVEYPILRCVQVVDGRRREYLSLAGTNGVAAAVGRSRRELLGDFRRRQIEGAP